MGGGLRGDVIAGVCGPFLAALSGVRGVVEILVSEEVFGRVRGVVGKAAVAIGAFEIPVDENVEMLAGALEAGDIVESQWVDNGPGWVAVRLESAEAVLAVETDAAVRVRIEGKYYQLRAETPREAAEEYGRLLDDGLGSGARVQRQLGRERQLLGAQGFT